jgi:hypothetical protein
MNEMKEEMKTHTVTFSDDIWNQAKRKGGKSVGPATYIRNIVVRVLLEDNGPQQEQSQQPANQRWSTDAALEEDFSNAIQAFGSTREEWYAKAYWPGKKMEKDPEEMDEFLGDLMDRYDEYGDLTTPQQNLLGMIRRAHNKWVKDVADEDEPPFDD